MRIGGRGCRSDCMLKALLFRVAAAPTRSSQHGPPSPYYTEHAPAPRTTASHPHAPQLSRKDSLTATGAIHLASLHPPQPPSPKRTMPRPIFPVVQRINRPRLPMPPTEPVRLVFGLKCVSQPGSAHFR